MIKLVALVTLLADCNLYGTKAECKSDCERTCRQAVTRDGEVHGWYCPDAVKDMPPTRILVE